VSSPAARIAAIVAAAGESRRFGSPKLLATIDHQPLIRLAVERVLQAKLNPVIVVLGRHGENVRRALVGLPVQFTENPDPSLGLGSSIAAGIRALPADTNAVIITLGDQPFLETRILEELADAWRRAQAMIVVPAFRGQRAPPVLFSREVFPELLELRGEAGGREIIDRDSSRVHVVHFDMPMPADVDTPEDLSRLEK
jgi:molybdenum cofactor cytidylyltransferase